MNVRCELDTCPKGKDICCNFCDEKDNCDGACDLDYLNCGESMVDETDLDLFMESPLMVKITNVVQQKKKLEEQEKAMKVDVLKAMEKFQIKKIENDDLSITYIAETTATSLDSAKLKKKYPQIAEECSKTSKKSAYVKIVVK